jgi:hypothetical protein
MEIATGIEETGRAALPMGNAATTKSSWLARGRAGTCAAAHINVTVVGQQPSIA